MPDDGSNGLRRFVNRRKCGSATFYPVNAGISVVPSAAAIHVDRQLWVAFPLHDEFPFRRSGPASFSGAAFPYIYTDELNRRFAHFPLEMLYTVVIFPLSNGAQK